MNRQNLNDIEELQKTINNAENYYEDYECYDESELSDDLIRYCIKQKLKRNKKFCGEEKAQYFTNGIENNIYNLETIEKDAKFWQKIKDINKK